MATWYVAPNGTGTSLNHWNTPVGAMNPGSLEDTINSNPVLAPGDEIWVLGDNNVLGAAFQGIYNLTAPLQINLPNLSIYGGFAGTENTPAGRNVNIDHTQYPTFFPNPSILDGGNANRVIDIQNAYNYRIDGFVIQNGNEATGDGGGMRVSLSNIKIENLVIMENAAGNRGGGMFLFDSGGHLTNIIFFKNSAAIGGGFHIDSRTDIIVANTLFNENTVNGTAANGNAIYADNTDTLICINNTIANNYFMPAISIYCNNSIVEIRNSILYPDNLVAVGGNITVDFCLLGVPPIGANVANPITGMNPNFINPLPLSFGGNYRLQPTNSPCINAGDNTPVFTSTDLEGNLRINGTNVDMGAIET